VRQAQRALPATDREGAKPMNSSDGESGGDKPVLGQEDLGAAAWLFLVPPLTGRGALTILPDVSAPAGRGPEVRASRQPRSDRPSVARLEFSRICAAGNVLEQSNAPSAAASFPFAEASFDAIALRGIEALMAARVWSGRLLEETARILHADGTLYLEMEFGGAVHGELGSWASLLKGVRQLWRLGLRPLRVFRIRVAQGRAYHIAPLLGSGSPGADMKALIAATLRGARIGLTLGRSGETLMDRIARSISGELPAKPPCALHLGSGRVLRIETARHVIRLPRGAAATRLCRHAFSVLQHLESCSLSFAVPRPVCCRVTEGQPVFVETRIGGRGVDYQALPPAAIGRIARQSVDLITELHLKTSQEGRITAELLDSMILAPLASLQDSRFGGRTSQALARAIRSLRAGLLGRWCRFVLAHGDFKITNLLVDEAGAVTGLVDWDRSELRAMPGGDLITYAAFDRVLMQRELFGPAIVRAAESEFARQALRNYRASFGLDEFLWNISGLLTLATYVRGQIEGNTDPDGAWIAVHGEALAIMCDRVTSGDAEARTTIEEQ